MNKLLNKRNWFKKRGGSDESKKERNGKISLIERRVKEGKGKRAILKL